MKRIYLDNAASTPIDPRVLEVISGTMQDYCGNPSSLHTDGTRSKHLLEESRSCIASFLQCSPEELFFTSGGTESNNLAIKGFALANRNRGNHIIISSIEHDCVLNACSWLRTLGYEVTVIPVGRDGLVEPEMVKSAIRPHTILVSVMHVNNEIGTIQPIAEIGKITREHGIALHTDACQSFGKIPVRPHEMNADMVTINSHKLYGPKGIGGLYIRKNTHIEPLFHGGGQERGYRPTTENIAGIAGFSMAVKLCHGDMVTENDRLSGMREFLMNRLMKLFPGIYFNGSGYAVPGILNFCFHGLEGESIRLLLLLDEAGISVSTGSACSSNHGERTGSHVLKAIGCNPVEARGGIRVSMGRFNRMEDLGIFCEVLEKCTMTLKSIFSN